VDYAVPLTVSWVCMCRKREREKEEERKKEEENAGNAGIM
jgi:hypothetical protein